MDTDASFSPRRNSFGCGSIFIAILIVGVGLFRYLASSQENPITGEKQRVAMTPEQEVALGLQSAPQMAQQMGGEVDPSSPQARIVERIGQQIVDSTEAHNGPYHYQYHLLADPQTINAFALPGGQVFITKGLLDRLQNTAQLAGVLGHETGHVINRHAAQQMAKSELGQSLVMASGVAASGDRDHPNAGYTAAMIANAVNEFAQLHYSRHDESEADTWGLKLMTECGYDPRAMVQVMEILKAAAANGGSQAEIFQTHPNPDHREADIKAWIDQHYAGGVPGNLTMGDPLNGSGPRERN